MLGVIIQVIPGWWYLYYHPANINHQLCRVLANNLNLKYPIWQIYVRMMKQSCFMHRHLCFKEIFFWTRWKKGLKICSYFHGLIHCRTTLKLIPYRMIFLNTYNMPGSVPIYFLSKQMSGDHPERLTPLSCEWFEVY